MERAGSYCLRLLSTPVNVSVLTALEQGPSSFEELRQSIGSPPPTTLRGHLRGLVDLSLVARGRANRFPASVEHVLTPAGRELLEVCNTIRPWLARRPAGPLQLGTLPAKSTLKALADGWSAAVIRALAVRPLSLTELSRLISGVTYPSLERRLVALRSAGLIEARPSQGRTTPYEVTSWLRGAAPLLAAAMDWETCRRIQKARTVTKLEVEALFLLYVTEVRLPTEMSGACRLVVDLGGRNGERTIAGVLVDVSAGRVRSLNSRMEGDALGSVSGSLTNWMRAIGHGRVQGLTVEGDHDLGRAFVDHLDRGALSAG